MEMTPQVLAMTLIAVIGGYWAIGKLLIGQFDKRMDERFAAHEAARKGNHERIVKLEAELNSDLDQHGERLSRLESHAENVPTHDHLSDIHEKINKVGAAIGSLSGEFTGVRNLLNTIHNHLLNNGSKK